MTRNLMLCLLLPVLAGCGSQPTEEELRERELELIEHCNDLLDEIEAKKGQPILRATAQEQYNRECLGKTYPEGWQ